jgi:hypothetical protein
LASSAVKFPVMTPCPPVMADRTSGAEMTTLSRTMASCRPTNCWVADANLLAPCPFSVNETCQPASACVCEDVSNTATAFWRSAPVITIPSSR